MTQARESAQNAVTPEDWDAPVSLYEKILEVEPNSAPAHARLARALFRQGLDLKGAESHARRAVEIDPNLSEGHSALGVVLDGLWRPGADQEFARAIELNPGDAEALHDYGVYLMGRGTGNPQPYLRKATNIDPLSPVKAADYAWSFVLGGRPGAGEAALKTIEERFPTGPGRFVLARTYGNQAGELDQAIAWGMEARRLDPSNSEVSRDIAEWLARLGMDEDSKHVQPQPSLRNLFWQRRYDETIELMSNVDLDEQNPDDLGYLAFAFQATGRDSEAIPVLRSMGLPDFALDVDLRRIAHLHHLAILIGSMNATGDTEEARKLARWLEKNLRPGIENDHGWGGHWWLGCALGVLGKREEALHEVEAMAAGSSLAWMPYLRDAACFRDLHAEPRYQKAVQRLQARLEAMRDRLPATLAQHGFTMDQF
jgi:Flp pilus assembly protein TadD